MGVGNARAAAIYLEHLPSTYPRPTPNNDALAILSIFPNQQNSGTSTCGRSFSCRTMTHWIKSKYDRKEFTEEYHAQVAVEFMDVLVTDPELTWGGGGKEKFTSYLISISVCATINCNRFLNAAGGQLADSISFFSPFFSSFSFHFWK